MSVPSFVLQVVDNLLWNDLHSARFAYNKDALCRLYIFGIDFELGSKKSEVIIIDIQLATIIGLLHIFFLFEIDDAGRAVVYCSNASRKKFVFVIELVKEVGI